MAGLCLPEAWGHLDSSLCTQAPGSLGVCPSTLGYWVCGRPVSPRTSAGWLALSLYLPVTLSDLELPTVGSTAFWCHILMGT